MFAKTIIDSDAFLDMPLSTQSLYFHLSMRADDDGFINNPRKIQRMIGATDDDLKLLIAKNFIITFESGVVVIKHWKIHNYIQKDRYKKTVYLEEKKRLSEKGNKAYTLTDTQCIQDVYNTDTQVRGGEASLGKASIELVEDTGGVAPTRSKLLNKNKKPLKHKYGEYKKVLLTDEQKEKLIKDLGENLFSKCITFLDEYIEEKGYKSKNHNLAIRRWVINAVKERERTTKSKPTLTGYEDMI